MDVQFEFTARSDVGLLRENNQDSGYAGQHLLVLADGMGGPAGGDIASSVAVAALAPLDEDAVPFEQMLTLLRQGLQSAHDELIERSRVEPQLRGLGTTCIALLRSGNKLAMAHIGDSRAYLLRGESLTQVTTDHSFVQYLVDSGQISPEEAENHPKRSVILRVLGDSPGVVSADETMREAIVGDRWLLCSDGLSGVVSAETIAEVLRRVPDLDACADTLIELALLGGAPDNVTVVLADVVPSSVEVSDTPIVVGAAAVERSNPSRRIPGAAGRAAALISETEEPTPIAGGAEEGPHTPKKRHWWTAAAALIVVALIAGGLWWGWQWTRTQYFALGDNGRVVVFQGIPQKIGSLELATPVEVTSIRLEDLPTIDQQRLEDPVTRSSREDIDQYLAELRLRQKAAEPTTGTGQSQSGDDSKPTPSPTPTPSPSSSPKAAAPNEGGGA
ncbi:protein phosphatase 2C domain-containing protein [Actinomyces sp. F1_1611]